MTATLLVYQDYGAGPTSQSLEGESPVNCRFKTDDNYTCDANYPIPIPGAGSKRSFWKHLYVYCSVAPTTKVDNVKIYTDGGGWANTTLYVGDETPTKNSGSTAGYDQASGVQGDDGDELVANHTNISAKTDMFTYNIGSSKSVTISETSSLIDATTETCDYVVMQLDVTSSASPATLSSETITWQYDEI